MLSADSAPHYFTIVHTSVFAAFSGHISWTVNGVAWSGENIRMLCLRLRTELGSVDSVLPDPQLHCVRGAGVGWRHSWQSGGRLLRTLPAVRVHPLRVIPCLRWKPEGLWQYRDAGFSRFDHLRRRLSTRHHPLCSSVSSLHLCRGVLRLHHLRHSASHLV